MASSSIQPALLRRMTARKVLESLQERGPLSRADLTRQTGISAPTVSKVVADLLETGILEEGDAPDHALGRPGRRIQLAREGARVIGIVLDSHRCDVHAASLDGRFLPGRIVSFATPTTYSELINQLHVAVVEVMERYSSRTLGIGISTPGLIDEHADLCAFSPNLQIINQRSPAADLQMRMGVTAVCTQESRALCLAERLYGNARGLDDFAVMDFTTGLGLGVFSSGELLRGNNGLAGEIGHITMEPSGRICGCGNRGCLETLATDAALATLMSERLNRNLRIEDVITLMQSGEIQGTDELNRVMEYLSIALSAAIHLFNPSALFVYGRFLSINDAVLEQLIAKVHGRTLSPSFAGCRIQPAVTSKQQGAIAAIVHHLTCAAGPRVG